MPAGPKGIVISVPNVTLDLNGYMVSGPMTCPDMQPAGAMCSMGYASSAQGIQIVAGDATVRNGTVRGFQSSGISVQEGGNSFVDLRLEHNAYGIFGSGLHKQSFVTRVSAERHMSNGIFLDGAVISSSAARGNGNDGFYVLGMSSITDSVSFKNRGTGFTTNGPILLRGNNAAQNTALPFWGNGTSVGGNLANGQPF